MKKLVVFACAALLLAGCGSSEPKKETKTCSMDVQGMKASIKLDAEDNIIKALEMKYVMPEALLGVEFSKMSDEDLKKLSSQALESVGAKEGEGIAIQTKAEDKSLVMSINVDLNKADKEILKKLNFDEKNAKLDASVEQAKKDGMTCE